MAINSSGDWIGFGCSGYNMCFHLTNAELSGHQDVVLLGKGQLLVWEWQSESYVFKQQGHFNNMASLAYSPDGQYIVTGGDDGKVSQVLIFVGLEMSGLQPAALWRGVEISWFPQVKVWNSTSGLCFVTFTEHVSGVTGVTFTSSGFVVVSASLDGTVRAFDLHR